MIKKGTTNVSFESRDRRSWERRTGERAYPFSVFMRKWFKITNQRRESRSSSSDTILPLQRVIGALLDREWWEWGSYFKTANEFAKKDKKLHAICAPNKFERTFVSRCFLAYFPCELKLYDQHNPAMMFKCISHLESVPLPFQNDCQLFLIKSTPHQSRPHTALRDKQFASGSKDKFITGK